MRTSIPLLLIISLIIGACQNNAPVEPPPETQAVEIAVTTIVVSTPTIVSVEDNPPSESTATPIPTPSATLVASPTPKTPPLPLPTPMNPLVDYYVIQAGDTLGGISLAYDITVDDLLTLNGFESDAVIINAGQTLRVPLNVSRTGPLITLLPDSEVVYSPAYLDFDIQAFLDAQGGFLATYSERVDGQDMSGAEMIETISRRFSVGPRVLLTLAEYYGGLVTQAQPTTYQLGSANPYADRFFLQFGWLANRVNEGYYGYKQSGSIPVRFRDRSRAIIPWGLNAGTAGIQNVLAVNSDWDTWLNEVDEAGFSATYRTLFGDPFARAVEPLIPIDLTQPPLALPWEVGQTFYFSGGPHPAYGDGSGWAAVDFGPPDVLGNCFYSGEYIVASADGKIDLETIGQMYLDLDGDGNLQTGWVLLYLHVVAVDALSDGQSVTANTPLGYASCEGGISNASHLHFARRYNGEWIAAGGPVPLVLSGWQIHNGAGQYEGTMTRGEVEKASCECWDEVENAIIRAFPD